MKLKIKLMIVILAIIIYFALNFVYVYLFKINETTNAYLLSSDVKKGEKVDMSKLKLIKIEKSSGVENLIYDFDNMVFASEFNSRYIYYF